MKMRHLIIYIALALTTVTAIAQNENDARYITVLHTNDTHSCILPMNPNLADTTVAGRGGFAERITLLKAEREKDPELLYIDSGDFCQGSSYFTMFRGDVEIGLMNRMGLDATTIGNHEWDFGLENLARMVKMANFPFVCSNYDFSGTALEGLVKPYITLTRKGVKIGIFAVCPELQGLVDVKNFQGVEYKDPTTVALSTATLLKEQEKCDVIICISHLGWGEDRDIAMIKGTRYIDLVLGGHSHTRFRELHYVNDLDGKSVPNDQNGKAAVHVGKMLLKVER